MINILIQINTIRHRLNFAASLHNNIGQKLKKNFQTKKYKTVGLMFKGDGKYFTHKFLTGSIIRLRYSNP